MPSKLKGPDRASLTVQFRAAASTNSGRYHIIPSHGKWVIKAEGSKKAKTIKATRTLAVRYAKTLSRSPKIVIHKEDGSIKSRIGLESKR